MNPRTIEQQRLDRLEHECCELLEALAYEHLAEDVRWMCMRFHAIACELLELPPGYQKVWALRLLIQTRDAAIRAKR